MGRRLFVLAILTPMLLLPSGAGASCVGLTPNEQVDRATSIFSGMLLEISADGIVKELTDELFAISDPGVWSTRGQVLFEVKNVYKGSVYRRQRVAHPFRTSIAVDFREGADYLVFARELEKGFLYTDSCNGTKEVPKDLDVYTFSNPTKPLAGTDLNPIPGETLRLATFWALVVLGGASLFGTVFFARKVFLKRRATLEGL